MGKVSTEMEEAKKALSSWVAARSVDDVVQTFGKVGVPSTPIQDIAQLVKDPQFNIREMLREVKDPKKGPIKIIGIVPKLSETPGDIRFRAPELGEHNIEIYGGLLNLTDSEVHDLEAKGVL